MESNDLSGSIVQQEWPKVTATLTYGESKIIFECPVTNIGNRILMPVVQDQEPYHEEYQGIP